MQLSAHFTLEEFVASQTAARLGMDNTPPAEVIETLRYTAGELEAVRAVLHDLPMHVDSAYRCLALNRALKSADHSDHVIGLAVDFVCPHFGTPLQVCRAIAAAGIDFRQLIYEHTWVHIAFPPPPDLVAKARVISPGNRVLTLMAGGGYEAGIVERAVA